MPKWFARYVAVLLIPCLIVADPALASVATSADFVNHSHQRTTVFSDQVLTAPDSGARFLKPFSVAITATVLVGISIGFLAQSSPAQNKPHSPALSAQPMDASHRLADDVYHTAAPETAPMGAEQSARSSRAWTWKDTGLATALVAACAKIISAHSFSSVWTWLAIYGLTFIAVRLISRIAKGEDATLVRMVRDAATVIKRAIFTESKVSWFKFQFLRRAERQRLGRLMGLSLESLKRTPPKTSITIPPRAAMVGYVIGFVWAAAATAKEISETRLLSAGPLLKDGVAGHLLIGFFHALAQAALSEEKNWIEKGVLAWSWSTGDSVEFRATALPTVEQARAILAHEYSHQFKQSGLTQSDATASAAHILRMAELIQEHFEQSGEAEPDPLSAAWYKALRELAPSLLASPASLSEGYTAMARAIEEEDFRSLLAASVGRAGDFQRGDENYSLSLRLGGMALYLFQKYPTLAEDPTGGMAWRFLKDLAEGWKPIQALQYVVKGRDPDKNTTPSKAIAISSIDPRLREEANRVLGQDSGTRSDLVAILDAPLANQSSMKGRLSRRGPTTIKSNTKSSSSRNEAAVGEREAGRLAVAGMPRRGALHDVGAEQFEIFDQWVASELEQHQSAFEKDARENSVLEHDGSIRARVILVRNLDHPVAAFHFAPRRGPAVIVVNTAILHKPREQEEAIFHELREIYWIQERNFRPEEAHVLASYDQAYRFAINVGGNGTLTPWHESQLQGMDLEQLQAILRETPEDRQRHREIVVRGYGNSAHLSFMEKYEEAFRQRAVRLADIRALDLPIPKLHQYLETYDVKSSRDPRLSKFLYAGTIYPSRKEFFLKAIVKHFPHLTHLIEMLFPYRSKKSKTFDIDFRRIIQRLEDQFGFRWLQAQWHAVEDDLSYFAKTPVWDKVQALILSVQHLEWLKESGLDPLVHLAFYRRALGRKPKSAWPLLEAIVDQLRAGEINPLLPTDAQAKILESAAARLATIRVLDIEIPREIERATGIYQRALGKSSATIRGSVGRTPSLASIRMNSGMNLGVRLGIPISVKGHFHDLITIDTRLLLKYPELSAQALSFFIAHEYGHKLLEEGQGDSIEWQFPEYTLPEESQWDEVIVDNIAWELQTQIATPCRGFQMEISSVDRAARAVMATAGLLLDSTQAGPLGNIGALKITPVLARFEAQMHWLASEIALDDSLKIELQDAASRLHDEALKILVNDSELRKDYPRWVAGYQKLYTDTNITLHPKIVPFRSLRPSSKITQAA